jgi:ATP-dependent Lhr-like helicase
MEEAGKIRRGYFVEGLGAAQFALPGAVDRLRAERTPPDSPVVQVLGAADPANPFGATLSWPRSGRLQRVSGAYLVTIDGEPALYIERGGKARGITTLPAFETSAPLALAALRRIAENTSRRELAIDHIDGEPSLTSALRPLLEQAGFQREYLGLTLRLPALSHPQARSA